MVSIDREEQALQLRAGGASYREIARVLAVAVGTAHKLVVRGLQRCAEVCEKEATLLRVLECERLDVLVRANLRRAEEGDVKAAGVVIKTIQERAKLLGLYAPTPVDVSGAVEVGDVQLVKERLEAAGLL